MSLADLRREYTQRGLTETEAAAEPFAQFRIWFEQALAANVHDANAMVLATATPDGRPSARVVLLKGFDERGFTFFTNGLSRKGREMAANPRVALTCFWPELERQVRIEGTAVATSPEESDAYFASRPVESRFGAAISPQSVVIPTRQFLEDGLAALKVKYPDGNVPRPPHWGGFRVTPEAVEFWQGRPARLHDRIQYTRNSGGWRLARLAP